MKASPASARMFAAVKGYGLQLCFTFAAAFVAPLPVEAAPIFETKTKTIIVMTAPVNPNPHQTKIDHVAAAIIAAKKTSSTTGFKQARADVFGAKDHYELVDYFEQPTKSRFAKIKSAHPAAKEILIAAVAAANAALGKDKKGGDFIIYRKEMHIDIF